MAIILDRQLAAQHLNDAGLHISKRALDHLAIQKKGPPYFIERGRAYYLTRELDAWLQQISLKHVNGDKNGS